MVLFFKAVGFPLSNTLMAIAGLAGMNLRGDAMKISWKFGMAVTLFVFLFAGSSPAKAETETGTTVIASRTAEVEGIKLHYLLLTAGHGSAVILDTDGSGLHV
jgi:hypothetical protein